MGTFIISVDLGQVNDFTAITIIECVPSGGDRLPDAQGGHDRQCQKGTETEYHLRHIERPERGTPYPKIVDRLKEIAESEQLDGHRRTVVIDITGVGLPVWDMLNNAGINAKLTGIHITGGNTVSKDGDIFRTPKRDLVSALQVAFQNGQLKIADGLPGADTLVRELTNFKVKISNSGHDQYGAAGDWREGIHDDLVLSAAMGVWLAGRTAVNQVVDIQRFKRYTGDVKKLRGRSFVTINSRIFTGERVNQSVISRWLANESGLYHIDCWWGRWDFPRLLEETRAVYREMRDESAGGAVYVEGMDPGASLYQTLRNEIRIDLWTPEDYRFPESKQARVQHSLPMLYGGKCLFTEATPQELYDEFDAFRNDMSHDHDDFVDTVTMGCSMWLFWGGRVS